MRVKDWIGQSLITCLLLNFGLYYVVDFRLIDDAYQHMLFLLILLLLYFLIQPSCKIGDISQVKTKTISSNFYSSFIMVEAYHYCVSHYILRSSCTNLEQNLLGDIRCVFQRFDLVFPTLYLVNLKIFSVISSIAFTFHMI